MRRLALLFALLCGLLAASLTHAAVDVNQATEAELDGLKGLGPATTRLILAERQQAPFRSWQDLQARVKGLGPASVRTLSEQGLRVQGQPYAPASRQP